MRRFAIAALVVGLLAWPGSAAASPRNGELCAVQAWDESIVFSVHTAFYTDASRATRQQLADAGAWCSGQLSVRGWMPASKFYDSYKGQSDVCVVRGFLSDITVWVHASPEAFSTAYDACNEIQGDNPNLTIDWWP